MSHDKTPTTSSVNSESSTPSGVMTWRAYKESKAIQLLDKIVQSEMWTLQVLEEWGASDLAELLKLHQGRLNIKHYTQNRLLRKIEKLEDDLQETISRLHSLADTMENTYESIQQIRIELRSRGLMGGEEEADVDVVPSHLQQDMVLATVTTKMAALLRAPYGGAGDAGAAEKKQRDKDQDQDDALQGLKLLFPLQEQD